MSELTPEQVANWRNVLVPMLGPYALLMPPAEINAVRDRMQERVNKLDDKLTQGGKVNGRIDKVD